LITANFLFEAPTQVRVGRGSAMTGLSMFEGKRVGLLASSSALRSPHGLIWHDSLRTSALAVTALRPAVPNPRIDHADEALSQARDARIDILVAFGGGSVIDAAKAVCLGLASGQSVRDLTTATANPGPVTVPLVAIPTAFGTGAEVSAGAILTDEGDGKKKPIRDRRLVPGTAIIDSSLASSLTTSQVLAVGIDALFHAVETFLSRAATPVTDIFARSVLGSLPTTLVCIRDESQNAKCMDELALASMLMGINLANASTCLPHRMQYALSGYDSSNHQMDLAALYPAWLAALERAQVARLDVFADGVSRALGGQRGARVSVADAFREFRRRLGLTPTLRDLGVTASDSQRLSAAVTGNIALDPLKPDVATIAAIFHEAALEPTA
jgi:alcohol dehydrogenase class IV